MFKWPNGTPSSRAPQSELADFVELMAWRRGSISATAVTRLLNRLDDNHYPDGVPEEERADTVVGRGYEETQRRAESCVNGYPFELGRQGNILRLAYDANNGKHAIYQYLLLATRLRMDNNREHAGIDGTLLFEELTAEVARNYFGDRAESMIFGTAAYRQGFPEKVEDLCKRLNEGDGFRDRDQRPTQAQDGKLDVVVWKPFTDNLPGKLIAFAQSKTGTRYEGELTKLHPSSFCDKWLQSSPPVLPVRMFFMADARHPDRWYSTSRDAGILFDRCRVIDFCDDVSADVLDRITIWTTAAATATELLYSGMPA